jgi:hypothetical protein
LTVQQPEGLVYEPELLTAAAERALLDEIERMEFEEIRMHGVVAKRTARHFGLDYDYERRGVLQDADPIPVWLAPVRKAAAELAGWQHHVPPAKSLRYSITFRTLRNPEGVG